MGLNSPSAYCLALVFISFVCLCSFVASSDDDSYAHCERVVDTWVEHVNEKRFSDDKLTLKDLLFFLHIPRTGGRTYFHCFLRKLYKSDDECPRSYDRLRFNPSQPNCKLVVSHDDYSLISELPWERTSVMTILRSPVDRVFSTYEFSIEVAARFLVHPNLTSVTMMSKSLKPKTRTVSTLDIWPWKYLVPWMREDLFNRRDARRLGRILHDEGASSYDMEDIVMPLHKFINDPIAHEIVHNGATFQVAGLTNNSHFEQSHEIRRCVRTHPSIGLRVLDVAKSRLDRMLYVGLTEDHEESARLFANTVGAQVLSQLSSDVEVDVEPRTFNTSDSQVTLADPDDGLNHVQNSTNYQPNVDSSYVAANVSVHKGNKTVAKLMEAYESCIMGLRKSQSNRRTVSLKRIAPANFTKEARRLVPKKHLEQIISLNSLDMELYEYAKKLFRQQHTLMQEIQDAQGNSTTANERPEAWMNLSPSPQMVAIVCLAGVSFIVVVVLLVVHARKRRSKLKV